MSKTAGNDLSELSLNEYFEGSTDLYCVLDFEGIFRHVNPAWSQVLGYDRDELVGHNFKEFVHPDDIQNSHEKFHDPDPLDHGQFRNRYRHKEGHFLMLLWAGHQDNKRTRIYAHARDVTKVTQSAALLRSVATIQEAYLSFAQLPQSLFEKTLCELILVSKADGGFIYDLPDTVNSGKAHPDRHKALKNFETSEALALAAETVSKGGVWTSDSTICIPLSYLGSSVALLGLKFLAPTVESRALSEHLKPVLEAASSVIGLFRAARRENELRERFHVIVENLPLMLTEFGPDGQVTWANRYCREKFGWTEVDFASRDLIADTTVDPEAEAREVERARKFMLSGRADWEDFTSKDLNGDVFPSTWTNIRLSDGRAIGIGQDLTDRKAAEAKMIQSSKMASLGEMSAGVSHEINNPLTIIQGSAFRALQNLGNLPLAVDRNIVDEVGSDLHRITKNGDRIARIVRGLRAFSRTDEHEPFMPTQLASVADDVLNLASERLRTQMIDLTVDVDPSITVDCRPVLLGQVLMNLLNNAFDALSESNRVSRAIKIKAIIEEDHVDTIIEDNGPGIPPILQNRILEPFFTTKDVGKGTGLGLSISKGIVESHSGQLLFESSDAGTRFTVRLPLRQGIDASL